MKNFSDIIIGIESNIITDNMYCNFSTNKDAIEIFLKFIGTEDEDLLGRCGELKRKIFTLYKDRISVLINKYEIFEHNLSDRASILIKEFVDRLSYIQGSANETECYNELQRVYCIEYCLYVYLVNESGKIVNKFDGSKYDGYYNFQNSNFKDGYAMIGNDLYNNKGELVKFDFEYDSVNYYGDGLAIVTVKEESYKGTVTKKGIYDLDNKKFVFELNETVYSISSLGEEMYLIYFNQEGRYVVYDARTNNSFYLGNRFDVLKTQYKDGYVIYQDTNAYEVYAMDRNGNKKLVANDRRHADIGQYSDGLVFIGDAFYDINGTKVIDLKDEGISNKPVFVNGYALVFFKTGYFTVLSKESKEYMFEPKAYTSMDNTYNGSFELGFYEDQTVVSNSGHLIIRFYDKELNTKHWSIINVKGEVVYDFSDDVSIKTIIADNGYIGVSSSKDNLSYYVSVNGDKLNISE